jgi:hypothetical protein
MAQGRKLTKVDVEVARLRARYQLAQAVVRWVGLAICVGSFWIPLRALQPLVDAIAGRETRFTLVVTVTLSITIAISVALAYSIRTTMTQRKTIEEQRNRISRLEGRLEARGEQAPQEDER